LSRAGWYAENYYPAAIGDDGELTFDTPTHTEDLFGESVASKVGLPR